MSAEARPISPASFALAIQELPLSSLFAKASELQNSLHHLRRSNEQLKPFADDGDDDCATAIRENDEVRERFEQRLLLLKAEVEGRGSIWAHGGAEPRQREPDTPRNVAVHVNGGGSEMMNGESAAMATMGTGSSLTSRPSQQQQSHAPSSQQSSQQSGRLNDNELRRLLSDRLGDPNSDDSDGGLHL